MNRRPSQPKRVRWWLILLIAVFVLATSSVIAYIVYPGHFDSVFKPSKIDAMRIRADSTYKTIKIPADWELRNTSKYGDALDGSEAVGTEYNYRSPGRPKDTFLAIQNLAVQAGFSVTEASGPETANDGSQSYTVNVEKRDDTTKVQFTVYVQRDTNMISVRSEAIQ